jgi:hypothetical protein
VGKPLWGLRDASCVGTHLAQIVARSVTALVGLRNGPTRQHDEWVVGSTQLTIPRSGSPAHRPPP